MRSWQAYLKNAHLKLTHRGLALGSGCTISQAKFGSNVRLGNGLTNDLQPVGIDAGLPADPIRYRFMRDDIACLNSLRGRDKELNWMRQNGDAFRDIARLKERL